MTNINSWGNGEEKPIEPSKLNDMLDSYKNSPLIDSELTDYFESLINNKINYVRDYSTCCSEMDAKLEGIDLPFYDQIITSQLYYMIVSFFEKYSNMDGLSSTYKDGYLNYKLNDIFRISYSRIADSNSVIVTQQSINKAQINQAKTTRNGFRYRNPEIAKQMLIKQIKNTKEKYFINISSDNINTSYLSSQLEQNRQLFSQEAEKIKNKQFYKYSDEKENQINEFLYDHFGFINGITLNQLNQILLFTDNESMYSSLQKKFEIKNFSAHYQCVWYNFKNKCERLKKILVKINRSEESILKQNLVDELYLSFLELMGLNEDDFERTSDSASTEQEEKSSIHIGKKLVLTNRRTYFDE